MRVAELSGADLRVEDWRNELEHRQAALKEAKERGFTHALIVDGDEVIEPLLLEAMLKVAESGLAERVYVEMDTYWKSPEYVIRPREHLTPCMMIDLEKAYPVGVREFAGGRAVMLPSDYGVMHHLSYRGPDSRIRRKLQTFSHRDEIVPGWFSVC